MTALTILQNYWKHDSFRHPQAAIINSVIEKRNVFALLPTGAGKSICYQIPTLLLDGVCIVISPLIALMQDQVQSLEKKGIKAIAITSKLREHDIIRAFDNLLYGNIKFLYLSPEKLQSEFIQHKIKQLKVSLIAIDEAHCISEWGHDFRPSYLGINVIKKLQPEASFIALTATATERVQNDIITLLELENPILYKETFQRKNLAYQVFEAEDIFYMIKRILLKNNAPAIIYVNTRNRTKEVSDYLSSVGFKSSFYHGGLNSAMKEKAFHNWMTEKTKIMVATNAFGMGIDKDNVKVVLHIEIPNSIENYVQEAGRAGRDGNKAFSVLLYNASTLHTFKNKVAQSLIQMDYLKKIYKLLNQHLFISKGEQATTAYAFNLSNFCDKYKLNIFTTFSVIQILEKEEVLTYNQNFNKISNVWFKSSSEVILNYTEKHLKYKKLVQLLLRNYGGVFENRIPIVETSIAKKINQSKTTIITWLKQLEKDGIIEYIYQTNDSEIQFLVMREDDRTINRISKNILQRNSIKTKKTKSILKYIEDNQTCRENQLMLYFDDNVLEKCEICDVCLRDKKRTIPIGDVINKILFLLDKNVELSSKEIVVLLEIDSSIVINGIKLLLEKNKIVLTETNTYKKKK